MGRHHSYPDGDTVGPILRAVSAPPQPHLSHGTTLVLSGPARSVLTGGLPFKPCRV
jgi:hypothetical protein